MKFKVDTDKHSISMVVVSMIKIKIEEKINKFKKFLDERYGPKCSVCDKKRSFNNKPSIRTDVNITGIHIMCPECRDFFKAAVINNVPPYRTLYVTGFRTW